jgi:hypothetical protein
MSAVDALWNLGSKAARRLTTAHKPIVRVLRRRARDQEHEAFAREVEAIDGSIAELAAGSGQIVLGPWLAEVGYEVLYWIPFLRWFADAYNVAPERLVVLSRGGMESAYGGIAGTYVDIFDLLSPADLAARNAARQFADEGGGQKQSGLSHLDRELIGLAGAQRSLGAARTLHPSLMFRLFRHAWHGNVPMDAFWRRTRYERMTIPLTALPPDLALPPAYSAAKIYSGPAIAGSAQTIDAVRSLVTRAAAREPVVVLPTNFGLDEHRDFALDDIPGVINLQRYLTPRNNLAVQLAVIAGARQYVGTCGGLAWLAPFLGVPTVALFDSDHLLAPHLLVARQAGKRAGAAEFTTLDLRALQRLGAGALSPGTLQ